MNGQWSTLYAPLGSLFRAQGKCETISYIHYRLQKCKNSGSTVMNFIIMIGIPMFFFPHAFLPRQGHRELFCWSASRHWDCFYTGQSPDMQSPRQSPLTNQGGCGGSRLGSVGSGGSCARRSLRDGGSPSRL